MFGGGWQANKRWAGDRARAVAGRTGDSDSGIVDIMDINDEWVVRLVAGMQEEASGRGGGSECGEE